MTATTPSKCATLQGAAANVWPGANATRTTNSLRILLDKIRNVRYILPLYIATVYCHCILPLSESFFPFAERQAGGKLSLFETLAHNLVREPRRGSDFFIFFTCNSLKKLDSEK
jgi:hypothetical protein